MKTLVRTLGLTTAIAMLAAGFTLAAPATAEPAGGAAPPAKMAPKGGMKKMTKKGGKKHHKKGMAKKGGKKGMEKKGGAKKGMEKKGM